jgi:hypothetical protein
MLLIEVLNQEMVVEINSMLLLIIVDILRHD